MSYRGVEGTSIVIASQICTHCLTLMAHFGNYHVQCSLRHLEDRLWGENGEFLVFMDAEDSSEGLVKAATRKKVYICLEVC